MTGNPQELKRTTATEFLTGILNGQRDFSYILLQNENLTQNPSYKKVEKYLRAANLKESPVILTGSRFVNLKAPSIESYVGHQGIAHLGLYLPHLIADNTQFIDSRLELPNLSYGSFTNSHWKNVELPGLIADGCDFTDSLLEQVVIYAGTICSIVGLSSHKKNLGKARLLRTEIKHSDITNIYLWADLEGLEIDKQTLSAMRDIHIESAENLSPELFKRLEGHTVASRKVLKRGEGVRESRRSNDMPYNIQKPKSSPQKPYYGRGSYPDNF